jgi:hypothetical protein
MIYCKKDNYDEPTSLLSGKLVYQGQTFGLERDQVPFDLFQFGFGKVGPIGASFTQEGTYSALLFDGEYKFTVPNGQGPFMWKRTAADKPDTVNITLRGRIPIGGTSKNSLSFLHPAKARRTVNAEINNIFFIEIIYS